MEGGGKEGKRDEKERESEGEGGTEERENGINRIRLQSED